MVHAIETASLVLILAIVMLSHVLRLSYELLHWPQWLVKHFENRRRQEITSTLEEAGFGRDVRHRLRKEMIRAKLKDASRYPDLEDRCRLMLRQCLIREKHLVGRRHSASFPYFIDLQTGSVDPEVADECAIILSGYLAGLDDTPLFDCVVGIKNGSPRIAMHFADRIEKGVALFRGKDEYKYNASVRDPATLFDGRILKDIRCLIVDDSTTGGRQVLQCVEAIGQCGGMVAGCLVLFEPIGKDARGKLAEKGVNLYSVIQMTPEETRRIS